MPTVEASAASPRTRAVTPVRRGSCSSGIDPAWSPDGTQIAFSSRRGGTFDIFVMSADGTGSQRLTTTREDDSHPTWSPDGRRIAFARGQPNDIYVMSTDGSDVRRISDPDVDEFEPGWSPDGRWIAYARREPGTTNRERLARSRPMAPSLGASPRFARGASRRLGHPTARGSRSRRTCVARCTTSSCSRSARKAFAV